MNWEIFIESKLVQDLGWTLIHSVWQIALISAVSVSRVESFYKIIGRSALFIVGLGACPGIYFARDDIYPVLRDPGKINIRECRI